MPQATDELRAQMEKWFGDDINDYGPYNFLRSRGYTETGGMIFPPVPAHTVSHEESACIDFLFQEWDYGFVGTAALAQSKS